MEYHKHFETIVVRTEHRVKLYIGGSAAGLRQAIAPIPIDAKMIDIDEDKDGNTILVFQTEQKQP